MRCQALLLQPKNACKLVSVAVATTTTHITTTRGGLTGFGCGQLFLAISVLNISHHVLHYFDCLLIPARLDLLSLPLPLPLSLSLPLCLFLAHSRWTAAYFVVDSVEVNAAAVSLLLLLLLRPAAVVGVAVVQTGFAKLCCVPCPPAPSPSSSLNIIVNIVYFLGQWTLAEWTSQRIASHMKHPLWCCEADIP